MTPRNALVLVKIVHTVVWAGFVFCIFAVPVSALAGHRGWALAFTGVVLLECAVLAANRWRCPLTDVAARFTEERADNFDIYLPVWLARYNKQVFGTLFAVGVLVFIWCSYR